MSVFCYHDRAFTLMEIMIVLIIVATIASFGMTNYYKSQEKAYFKNATSTLEMIARAQEMFSVRNGFYYPESTTVPVNDYNVINDELNIGIIEDGFTYSCKESTDVETYKCVADRDGGAYSVKLERYWSAALSDYAVDITCIDGNKSCP